MRTTNVEGAPAVASDRTLPADPIIERVEGRGGLGAVLSGYGDDRRNLKRLRLAYHRALQERRVSIDMADELVCHLFGEHPITVYGDDWLSAGDSGRPPHDPTKGKTPSNSGYNRGCRCIECTIEHNEVAAVARARRKAAKAAAADATNDQVIDLTVPTAERQTLTAV